MTGSLATYTPDSLQRSATASEIRAQVNLIQEVMKAVMKDGVHYGTIPGTPKPTLYKAGSEKILSTFRIAIEPIVTDLSTPDEARFRVETRATAQSSGAYLGSGIGEASSMEEKYKWRGIVCQEEFDETPEDRRRKVWKRRGGKPEPVLQIRTQPADVANTILKMAKKRSQIDATLTVTAASDVFAQDIEDLPDDVREAVGGDPESPSQQERVPIQPPQRKAEPASTKAPGSGTTTRVTVIDIAKKSGTNEKGAWARFGIKGSDGKYYNTFDTKLEAIARDAKDSSRQVEIVYTESKFGRDIVSLTAVDREAGDEF